MESAVRHQYDASLALQPVGSVAITATAASTAVDIQEITKSPYGALNGRHGEGTFDIVLYVAALDHTTGDETYTLAIQTVNGSNAVTVIETVVLTVAELAQTLVFPVSPKTLEKFDPDAQKIQLNLTLAGTSPILQYWAFVAPGSHA